MDHQVRASDRIFLDHSPTAPSRARRWAGKLVGEDWGFGPETAYDVALVVSELVTNVVRHVPRVVRGCARGIAVGLEGSRETLRIEVADADGGRWPEVPASDGEAEGGRGLLLVTGLARRWGVAERRPLGKVVWAELALDGPAPGSERFAAPCPAGPGRAVATALRLGVLG